MPGKFFLVLSTAPKREASSLAGKIVDKGLAACVNVADDIWSHYVWRGKTIKSRESLLIIKTTQSKKRALMDFITREHSYEVPEIIALPFSQGEKAYLRWLAQSVAR